jgi:hypothetical protein
MCIYPKRLLLELGIGVGGIECVGENGVELKLYIMLDPFKNLTKSNDNKYILEIQVLNRPLDAWSCVHEIKKKRQN